MYILTYIEIHKTIYLNQYKNIRINTINPEIIYIKYIT
jgi:hypothetical protein